MFLQSIISEKILSSDINSLQKAMFEAYTVSDVALKSPTEISSLCCRKSTHSVLAGSKDGTLFAHKLAMRGEVSLHRYTYEYICKKFERNAVLNMTLIEEKNLILCISQGLVAAHVLSDLQHPVINVLLQVKPVVSFAYWIREDDDLLYIITSSKKKIQLFLWTQEEFTELPVECSAVFTDSPANLRMCKDWLIFSVKDEYYVSQFTHTSINEEEAWNLDVRKVASSTEPPVITYIDNHNLGDEERPSEKPIIDIRFSDPPLAIVYDNPFLIALLSKGRIEVRTFNPSILIQNMVLSKSQFLCNGNSGQVYVGSSNGVWVLDTAPGLRKNVATLVTEKHFDLAIQLAETSKIFTDENIIEIKRQTAANLFNQRKFEESFQLHLQIGSDVIQVVHLIPDLLPDVGKHPNASHSPDLTANDKKRALLAMGNYLSAKRVDYVNKLELNGHAPQSKEDAQNTLRTLIIIDTTLLNCYLQTKPILVDSLLRLHNNSCTFEDTEAILKKANKLSSLFVLYETRKKHELALELLWTQSQLPDPIPFFKGNEKIVDYLQSLGNTHLELIFKYAKKILLKNLDDGLSIFTGEESDVARTLDRDKVLEFLKENSKLAVIPYLEHIIYKWDESSPNFHEALLEQYIVKVKKLAEEYVHVFNDDQNVSRAGEEEGELGEYRTKLIHFLQYSLQYSPQGVLLQLGTTSLYEERALILGSLKMHEQALTIYTSILNDFSAAQNYCQLYYDRKDHANSQVYLQWLRAYISPYDPHKAGITETSIPVPPPDVLSAIRVLSRHADKIDTVAALSDFPDDIELRTLSRALIAVLQTVHDNSVSLAMRQAISHSALTHAEGRLKQLESTRIVVTNSSDCVKCGKKIGTSAFVRSPEDESLIHFCCNV